MSIYYPDCGHNRFRSFRVYIWLDVTRKISLCGTPPVAQHTHLQLFRLERSLEMAAVILEQLKVGRVFTWAEVQ